MKNFLLSVITTLSVSCLGCAHHSDVIKNNDTAVERIYIPAKAHLVWCREYNGCFQAAATFCGEHHHPGTWKQMAEPGMSFPAMVQEKDNSWHTLIICDNE